MSGLLFLSSDDFNVQQGQRGKILCTQIKGFSVILFYSVQCDHCQTLIPIFKTLPQYFAGFQFGMINISNNKNVIMMAKDTIAPITYVPYVLFFVDGKPFMQYSGPYELSEIRRFITEVANDVKSKAKFFEQKPNGQQSGQASVTAGNKIPEYAIGIPKCKDNVCYLEFDKAYSTQESKLISIKRFIIYCKNYECMNSKLLTNSYFR